MNESDKYLLNIVKKWKSKPVTFYDPRITDIKNIVRNWAGDYLFEIKLSGSCAKNTAISGVSDCDLFISLVPHLTNSLKEIYNSLEYQVSQNGYKVRRQNVSLGIKCNDLSVDLVPARIQNGYINYHSLYSSKNDTWLQTNIKLHIDKVVNSARQDEIILTKVWRKLHGLSFPSIYLELIVLDALYYKHSNQPEINFNRVLEFLANDFLYYQVKDPANSNNIISDMLTSQEKLLIQKQAQKAITAKNWNEIIW